MHTAATAWSSGLGLQRGERLRLQGAQPAAGTGEGCWTRRWQRWEEDTGGTGMSWFGCRKYSRALGQSREHPLSGLSVHVGVTGIGGGQQGSGLFLRAGGLWKARVGKPTGIRSALQSRSLQMPHSLCSFLSLHLSPSDHGKYTN